MFAKKQALACDRLSAYRVAEDERGRLLAALVLGEAQPYVPPATEPEIYVRVFFADSRARAAGMQRLRVDCHSGGTGELVRFYESCGYERITTFSVDGWLGQLLGRSLGAAATS